MIHPEAGDYVGVMINMDAPNSDGRPVTQLLRRHVKRFRKGLVFEARRLSVSLNSMLESNKEEAERPIVTGHALDLNRMETN